MVTRKHKHKLTTKTLKNKHVYKKKDYNANDGMITSVWGPALWHYLHTMSFNYPVKPTNEEKKYYRDLLIEFRL